MLLVTGLGGMYGAVVLVAERVMLWNDPSHITSCDINPWASCGEVMKTWQSQLFGFPNQFIGLVAFSIIITIAMALFAGARFRRWFWIGMNVGVFLGFAFCVWLWSQAVYEINILCLYCMVVWAMMIPMFVLLTSRNLQHGVIPAPAGVRRFAAEWSWPVIALLYVGVLASIMLRFSNAFF
ncbi:MAG: vitamin K epoxide reductase family protein [Micrococcus sp.]|nr:vitamin K epoxide reductase family protein [Micrococcus sp.]